MTQSRAARAVIAAVLAAGLGACGEKAEAPAGVPPRLAPVTLVLDRAPSTDHAGVYAAQATGAFRRAGLDVAIRTPRDPSEPLELVTAGRADVAITSAPELFLARDKDVEVVGVGALVQRPLASIIALGSARIRTPADLAGATVGTGGLPSQAALLRAILKAEGVDRARVETRDVGFGLAAAMLSGRVDATLGGFWNAEGLRLRRAGKRPTIIRMDQAGVPGYDELVLVGRQDRLRTRGPLYRRLLQALQQGTKAVRADPSVGVAAVLAAAPGLDRGEQTAALTATLPAFFPAEGDRPFGWQDPPEWQRFGRWMLANGLLERPPSQALLTNEFLPGEGVAPLDTNGGLEPGS